LSSTTDVKRKRGQIVVMFALALFVIVLIAALAFDGGLMLLERRDQQNAADAAALAGARYLDYSIADADPQARAIATENGFTNGVNSQVVQVYIPPTTGQFRALPGFVEVVIGNRRPSIFAGAMGVAGWNVSARAVAANQHGLDLPFAMLTLDPTSCSALKITGTGFVNSNGSIQVNSSCTHGALDVGGSGVVRVTADGARCNAVGDIDPHGGGELNCTTSENSYAIPDPLKTRPAPPVPPYPAAIEKVVPTTRNPPAGCPGSTTPATATVPRTCAFNGSYDGTVWRFHPGYYPGGIKTGKATLMLEPGMYYIGGGGLDTSNGSLNSVAVGGVAPPYGGGVLIYNTEAYNFSAQCAAGTATNPAVQCIQSIILSGGSAGVNLLPLDDGSVWDGMVIFQDRNLSVAGGKDIQINGGTSTMEVAGTIYVPKGAVEVNGSASRMILDQVIAYTYKVNGSGGTIDILYRDGVTARISGVGLVE
jgi:hypothetical protein